jgi:hypothetical protein
MPLCKKSENNRVKLGKLGDMAVRVGVKCRKET